MRKRAGRREFRRIFLHQTKKMREIVPLGSFLQPGFPGLAFLLHDSAFSFMGENL